MAFAYKAYESVPHILAIPPYRRRLNLLSTILIGGDASYTLLDDLSLIFKYLFNASTTTAEYLTLSSAALFLSATSISSGIEKVRFLTGCYYMQRYIILPGKW